MSEATAAAPRFINLAANEGIHKQRSVPPVKVYIGQNLFIEIKEFRKTLYVGFYKEENDVIKNRLNFPISQLEKVEEGLQAIKDHVINFGQ